MSNLEVTSVGRAVAKSGLLPKTAAYYFDYFRSNAAILKYLLEKISSEGSEGDPIHVERFNTDLGFILFHLCYSSPEFGDEDVAARRSLPYPLGVREESDRAMRLEGYLAVQPWDQDVLAVNAADISTDWISGMPLSQLENRYERLRGGMIRDMLRTASSHLAGLAAILAAAASSEDGDERPDSVFAWCSGDHRVFILRIIRRVHQYALQALAGIPDDLLWMVDVVDANGERLIPRRLAMNLRECGLKRLEDLLDQGRTNQFINALDRTQEGRAQIVRIRQAAERARLERTERNRARIERRLPDCESLVSKYFLATGKEFEECLEDCLHCLGIKIIGKDDDNQAKPRYPDFVIEYGSGKIIVIECKSSDSGKDVGLTAATDVGGKAALHALTMNHLVTICQKYVSTDVPRKIEAQANLSVVNAEDMGLAMAYLKSKSITMDRFINWLTTPGQPRVEELFLA